MASERQGHHGPASLFADQVTLTAGNLSFSGLIQTHDYDKQYSIFKEHK